MVLLDLKRRVLEAPDDAEARTDLAEALYAERDLAGALKQLEKALTLDPDRSRTLRLAHRVYLAAQEPKAARKALEHLCDVEPNDGAVLELLADDALENERLDDALVVLLDALELGPPAPQRFEKAITIAARTGRKQLARKLVERALLAMPTDAALHEARRRVLVAQGEDDVWDLVGALAEVEPLAGVRDAVLRRELDRARAGLVHAAEQHRHRAEWHLLRAEVFRLEGKEDKAAASVRQAEAITGSKLVWGRLAERVRLGEPRRMGVLGWSPWRGAVSPLEAVAVAGTGSLYFSGNVHGSGLEAGRVAHSLLKAQAVTLGLGAAPLSHDLHFNFTDVDLGKEGTSSGLALTLAGHSAFSRTPLRPWLGATGTITLSGEVGRIDGVHEKLTAAALEGLTRVLVPRVNRPEVDALPARVRRRLEVRFVGTLQEALVLAHD